VEPPVQPAGGLAVEMEVEERARLLAWRVLGRRHGKAVEPAADGEAAAAPRHFERAGRRGQRERETEDRRDRVEPPGSPLYTPRMDQQALDKDLDRQIATTHRRFVKAMDGRAPAMSLETKERYFGVRA